MLTDRIANFIRHRSTRRSSARRISSPTRARRFIPGAESAALESRELLTTVTVGQYSLFQYSQDGYLAFYNNGTLTEVNMNTGTTTHFNVGTTWTQVLQIADALVYFNGNGTSVTEVNLKTASVATWNVGSQSTYWIVPVSGQKDGCLAFYNAGTLYDINLDANSETSFNVGTNWTNAWQPPGSTVLTFYGNGVVTEVTLPSGGAIYTFNVGSSTNVWAVDEIANGGGASLNFYNNGLLTQIGLLSHQAYSYGIGAWTSVSEYKYTLDFINGGTLAEVDLLNHADYFFTIGSFTNSFQTYNGLAYYDGSSHLTAIDFTTQLQNVYTVGTWTTASQVNQTIDFYNGNTITVVNLGRQLVQSFNVGSYSSSWQLLGPGTGNTGFLAFYNSSGTLNVIDLAALGLSSYYVGSWTTAWNVTDSYLAFYNSANGYLVEVDPTAAAYTFFVGAGLATPSQQGAAFAFVGATTITTVNLALHNSGSFSINGSNYVMWYLQSGNGSFAYNSPNGSSTLTVIDLGTETSRNYTIGSYTDFWKAGTSTLTFENASGQLTEVDVSNQTTTTYNLGSFAHGTVNGNFITYILGNGNVAVLNTATKHLVTYVGGSWNGFWEIAGYVIFYYQSTGLLTYTPMP